MSKSRFFTGQPIFSQLLSLIPSAIISAAVKETSSDNYYKKFDSNAHLVSMLYASYQKCTSLREVTTGLLASQHKIGQLGLSYIPKRSTLSDANRNRNEQFFAGVFKKLYKHYYPVLPDSRKRRSIESRVFLIDSTTITLFTEIMRGMGQKPADGRKKGGVKAHMLVKASEDVPMLVDLTDGTKNDKHIFKILEKLPAKSIVVFDKGYNSYAQFDKWDKESVTWVTRSSNVACVEVISEREVSAHQHELGVIKDENVILGRLSNNNRTLRIHARRVTFYDKASKKTFEFITNDYHYSPATIADIYKSRWQIELLFKRIKQNYPVQYFLGDNENAIKVQIWCALIGDLLLKIIKERLQKSWSYANIAGMVRLHLMTYIKLIDFFNNPEQSLLNNVQKNMAQLSLFT